MESLIDKMKPLQQLEELKRLVYYGEVSNMLTQYEIMVVLTGTDEQIMSLIKEHESIR